MNTNLIHNILNVAIAVVAAMAAFDWTVLLSPSTAAAVVAGLATLKTLINVFRDGFSGLAKTQPPVE